MSGEFQVPTGIEKRTRWKGEGEGVQRSIAISAQYVSALYLHDAERDVSIVKMPANVWLAVLGCFSLIWKRPKAER